MPRRSIDALPLPSARYDVSKLDPELIKFETAADVAKEDRQRSRRARIAKQAGVKRTKRFRRLLRARSKSLASATAMRERRRKVVGAIWELVDAAGLANCSTVTLIPRAWTIPAKDLHATNPRKLIAQARSQLYRCGAKDADGFLIAFLHGEYEPHSDTFVLHLHGVVSCGMRDVVDRFKGRRNYRHLDEEGRKLPIKGVRRSRQALSNMPAPLTYLLQSYWPSRWKGQNAKGQSIRQRDKSRIPEPRHTEVLMWLDRWSLSDITLSIGVTWGNRGARLSH